VRVVARLWAEQDINIVQYVVVFLNVGTEKEEKTKKNKKKN
jgi:hypothetical protein